jgi:PAS domain S-box-containing protein
MTSLSALILEDWKPDFELVAHQLRSAGFDARCHQVETMDEYLVQLDAAPDVILADYALPGFDALHALQLLQARGQDIPFLVLTGVVDEEALVECIRRGAVDYLLKDRLARLGPAVHRALQESEVRRKRRAAEIALGKSNRRFQYLVETTGAIPWEMDADNGRFTYVGPQAVKLLGYPVEEWYRAGFWDGHVHPEDRGALRAQPSENCERTCRMRTQDGAMVYLHCAISKPSPDSNGSHLYGFMMDITEMKSMQDSLASQAAALASSNEELKQFAYAASHDLQEPLRMVAFYTQLLAKRYRGKLDSDADEFIGYALEGATRMRDLVKHLLIYSRVSIGKPSMAPTNSEEVFQECLANLRLALTESGAINFLHQTDKYANAPRPDLILLDLRLPKKSGFEVLHEIKQDPVLATIPVVIQSSSEEMADIQKAYSLHANCYIAKPDTLDEFSWTMQLLADLWLTAVKLPEAEDWKAI